jgi:predicted nuclease with TOPRIM domain
MEPIPKVVPTFEQTEHNTRQTRRELDEHVEQCESGFRWVRVLWAIVILLAVALGGLSWYAYRSIDNHNLTLAQAPSLQTSANAMGERLRSIEGKINDWTNDRRALTDRMTKLEKTLGSDMKTARNQMQAAANQMGQRVRDEVNQSLQRLQGRVETVEATQRENHDQLAAAQNEIGSLRQEIAGLQKQNEQRLAELQQTQGNVNRLNSKVGAIDDQVMAHTTSLNALNEQVEREPVNFELSNNSTQQVAPGIYVTIKHTDVAHQKVDGWMQLADEGRIVWIRDLGAQQPLPFVSRSDDRSYALVFTGVQQNGASGYMLVPHSLPPTSSAN